MVLKTSPAAPAQRQNSLSHCPLPRSRVKMNAFGALDRGAPDSMSSFGSGGRPHAPSGCFTYANAQVVFRMDWSQYGTFGFTAIL